MTTREDLVGLLREACRWVESHAILNKLSAPSAEEFKARIDAALDSPSATAAGVGKLVQQRPGCKDCFIACLAMAEGVSYEEIERRVPADLMSRIREKGAYDKDVEALWSAVGAIRGLHYRPVWGFRGPQTAFAQQWLFARRAILQVDSVNFSGESHIVYWDGEKLYDPSLLKTVDEEYVWKDGFHWAWLLSDWGTSTAAPANAGKESNDE